MTAGIIQFIPRPNPDRDLRTLEQQAIEIMNVAIIPHDAAIADTAPSEYCAPESDPA
ncbi:MAG: hypothetical protein JWP25_4705 [Bradyrhizobium sp.]|nr:hypothetical protein [Bradyrhizobium sp.]